MFDRLFHLTENKTTVRTELLAGMTTFLTMAYIIVVQPAVLSGGMFNKATGMDFGSVTTATCLSAALATIVMGLYARYPIAQAPGMGENFFFVFSLLPAAGMMIESQIKAGTLQPSSTTPWQIGLGVIFYSGVLFLLLSMLGVREKLMEAISPSMRNGIAVGIGLFIAFIGLQFTHLVIPDPGTCVKMNVQFSSPDIIVFFFGLIVTAVLHARRVRGSILWGIIAGGLLAVALCLGLPYLGQGVMHYKPVAESMLMTKFALPAIGHYSDLANLVSAPPSIAPTFFKMDLIGAASWPMLPFIFVFLFMVLFDTLGTLIGVAEQAGFIKDNRLPRAHRALISDALGTVAGAALGTSTVTSFIESASGVEQGGRTGLTALTVAALFLLALFFSPIIAIIGSYPPITAPALVVVGAMMMTNITKVQWRNYAESIPSFLIIIGIPMTFSIADGLALGCIAYPIIKLLAGQGRDVKWLMYIMAVVLIVYFVLVVK
ncbi:MAG: NCS2 family permease [Thermoguttaceae bacterium]|jgi:AGZA family xanthine/uracil permease-like MFS transporter